MASFLATFTNTGGQQRQLKIRANSAQEARRDLRRRGIRPLKVELLQSQGPGPTTPPLEASAQPKRAGLAGLLEARPGIKEKALFASKLSALVNAGVPIVRSLSLLSSQQRMPLFKRALNAITADVNQGSSLASAMRRWPSVFDRLSIAMVEAGEAGGVLDETLQRLAKLLEDSARLRNQIKGAMGYPVAVLVIAITVFLGMTIFLIPTFAGIFEDLGAELPAFTKLMLNLSSLLRSPFAGLLTAGLILASWIFARFYATRRGRRKVDSWLLKLPLFGDLLRKSATAQFCRTFSSLSRAGVPILLSLEIVQETTGNSIIADAIINSRQEVLEGIPLSHAIARKKVFPDMAVSMLAIGEETGGLDAMLSKVADFYEDEVETSVKALTAMLEPALIVVVGGIVGSILLAMYLPMFSVFDQIN
ncbi:MAG: type II secretion system F family protein [Cyanobacteriota bacterium]|nr:type II secretion system F family protein [Cyanobacteriota bacterium]